MYRISPTRCCAQVTLAALLFSVSVPAAAQVLSVTSGTVTDDCQYGGSGDGDGSIDPGETISFWVEVLNFSSTPAANTNCRLECDPTDSNCVHVNITKQDASFGTIPGPGTKDNQSDPWTIEFLDSAPCDTSIHFLFHFTYDTGSQDDDGYLDTAPPAECIACVDTGGPNLAIESLVLEADACALGLGNMDGEAEPGESITLKVTLTNTGTEAASTIIAVLSSGDANVTQANASLASLDPAATADLAPSFAFDVPVSALCNDALTFTLTLTYDQGKDVEPFTIMVPAEPDCEVCGLPDLQFSQGWVLDECVSGGPGDGDLQAEPGEKIRLLVALENIGAVQATDIIGVLSSGDVDITQDTATLASLSPGTQGDLNPRYRFDIPGSLACGDLLSFTLDLTYDEGSEVENFSFNMPTIAQGCIACQLPDLAVDGVVLTGDRCLSGGSGDTDGEIEPGENAAIRVTLRNDGSVEATSIEAILSSGDVSVTSNLATLSSLPSSSQGDLTPAFDFDVPLSVVCGQVLNFRLSLRYAEGSETESFTLTVPGPATCDICSVPDISVEQVELVQDQCSSGGPGSNDGEPEPGEQATIRIGLRNDGLVAATDVSALLFSGNVTVTQPAATLPSLPASGQGDLVPELSFSVPLDVVCGGTLDFILQLSYNEGSDFEYFTLPVPSGADCNVCTVPQLAVDSVVITGDQCSSSGTGDNDGEAEPGERVSIRVRLRNDGLRDASNITALLTSADVVIDNNSASLPALGVGTFADLSPDFTFAVPASALCGDTLGFTLSLTYDEGNGFETFSIAVPTAPDCDVCTVPRLEVDSWTLVDSCSFGGQGDGNQQPDPGEEVELTVLLHNVSSLGANNIKATLVSDDVTVTQPTAALAALGPDQFASLAPACIFTVGPEHACSDPLLLFINLTYDEGSVIDSIPLTIPDTCFPCASPGCRNGTPDRLVDFILVRTGTDMEFHWTRDAKAEGGFNFYVTGNPGEVSDLRRDNSFAPFLWAQPAEPDPFIHADGVNDVENPAFYQVLGVCIDPVLEGPN